METDLRQFHAEKLFENGEKSYFLKPLELQRTERMDFTRVPADKNKFEEYVVNKLRYKDQSIPYILSEFIEGQEYAANILCHQGKLLMCQVTLLSIFNFNQDKILVTSDLYFWNLQVNSFPTRYHTS